MANNLANRIRSAFVLETVARIRTCSVDASGAEAAVIVEVTAIGALFAAVVIGDTDLAKGAVGVASAACKADAVSRGCGGGCRRC